MEALFDIKVIVTDAPSHLHRTPESIGSREDKKAVDDSPSKFTPFVTSVDGLLH